MEPDEVGKAYDQIADRWYADKFSRMASLSKRSTFRYLWLNWQNSATRMSIFITRKSVNGISQDNMTSSPPGTVYGISH